MRIERQMNRVPGASMGQLKIEHLLHRNAVPSPSQTHPRNGKPPKLLHLCQRLRLHGVIRTPSAAGVCAKIYLPKTVPVDAFT